VLPWKRYAVIPSSVFTIGHLARSETEITPKHLHKQTILYSTNTSPSASLVDVGKIDVEIRELALKISFPLKIDYEITVSYSRLEHIRIYKYLSK
jgi:hypothetical protein